MRLMKWYNLPSIVCLYTTMWDVKGYMVTSKCDGRSYVVFLLKLPVHHLKYKHITLKLLFKQVTNMIYCIPCTYVLTARHVSRSLVTTKWQ